jgi:pre-mRNA-processing factor 8
LWCALSCRQVAFPYLYNNRPRKVRLSVYHYPMVMYIKTEDPDLPAFYYDPLIHPITSYKMDLSAGQQEEVEELDEEWALPEGVEPLLEHCPVYTDTTAAVRRLLGSAGPLAGVSFGGQGASGSRGRWCSID